MIKFVKNILIFVIIISVILAPINYLYGKHQINYGTMGDKKNDNAYIIDVPDEIQICNFGNSHGYYDFDYSKYKDKYVCFNFSLPSQKMSYNYRILDNYKNNISLDAVILICISYTSFYGEAESDSDDFAAKNKRYYHFLDNAHIKEYDLKTDILINYFPMLTSPNWLNLVKTVMGVNKASDLWSFSTNEHDAKKHGLSRFEKHITKNIDENGERIINYEEIDSVYKMIELCHEIGARPVLITTPYLSEYTDAVKNGDEDFYSDFYNQIDEIIDKTGVEYYDYQFDSRFISSYSLFMNTDHLNRRGAQIFTDIIIDEIYPQSNK